MKIDVALNPAEIGLLGERDLSGTTCIVFDILRATSSMITALAHQAAKIHPVRTIEEALELKERMPDALLGGERHGDRIAGFDLGNSPLEYREGVRGRSIITTTTNGTFALCACAHAARVFVGALLNIEALADELTRNAPANLLLVCAGTFETFALEDALAAGVLLGALEPRNGIELSDAAQAARLLSPESGAYFPLLRSTRNGLALISNGREDEVEWCARRSQYKIIGCMQSGVIRPLL